MATNDHAAQREHWMQWHPEHPRWTRFGWLVTHSEPDTAFLLHVFRNRIVRWGDKASKTDPVTNSFGIAIPVGTILLGSCHKTRAVHEFDGGPTAPHPGRLRNAPPFTWSVAPLRAYMRCHKHLAQSSSGALSDLNAPWDARVRAALTVAIVHSDHAFLDFLLREFSQAGTLGSVGPWASVLPKHTINMCMGRRVDRITLLDVAVAYNNTYAYRRVVAACGKNAPREHHALMALTALFHGHASAARAHMTALLDHIASRVHHASNSAPRLHVMQWAAGAAWGGHPASVDAVFDVCATMFTPDPTQSSGECLVRVWEWMRALCEWWRMDNAAPPARKTAAAAQLQRVLRALKPSLRPLLHPDGGAPAHARMSLADQEIIWVNVHRVAATTACPALAQWVSGFPVTPDLARQFWAEAVTWSTPVDTLRALSGSAMRAATKPVHLQSFIQRAHWGDAPLDGAMARWIMRLALDVVHAHYVRPESRVQWTMNLVVALTFMSKGRALVALAAAPPVLDVAAFRGRHNETLLHVVGATTGTDNATIVDTLLALHVDQRVLSSTPHVCLAVTGNKNFAWSARFRAWTRQCELEGWHHLVLHPRGYAPPGPVGVGGETLLALAIQRGDHAVTRALLQRPEHVTHANLNARDGQNAFALQRLPWDTCHRDGEAAAWIRRVVLQAWPMLCCAHARAVLACAVRHAPAPLLTAFLGVAGPEVVHVPARLFPATAVLCTNLVRLLPFLDRTAVTDRELRCLWAQRHRSLFVVPARVTARLQRFVTRTRTWRRRRALLLLRRLHDTGRAAWAGGSGVGGGRRRFGDT